tara:strand:+ start:453 stop:1463 length:1011 start_codon:yes stop_codon:yes gene_type:complete
MNRLTDCIINKKSSLLPVWFMRQAGRYLPEFREIRQQNQDFIKLCCDVNLVKEITLQPIKRFDLDAAIIFSDILMVPFGLGQNVKFKKNYGPSLEELDLDKILNCKEETFIKKLKPVYEAISSVKKNLNNKSCIGFVGAPWTILVYMINKKSPKQDFNFENLIKDEYIILKLFEKIKKMISIHIRKQIEAGADIIQIFDSWAGLIPEKNLKKYCYEPNFFIKDSLKKTKVPLIFFPKGIKKNYLNFCDEVKPDCINIDPDIDPEWAKKNFNQIPIQGGLDPKTLLKDEDTVKKEVKNYINIFSDYPYIFNLGHGVLPQTKVETVKLITEIVQGKRK